MHSQTPKLVSNAGPSPIQQAYAEHHQESTDAANSPEEPQRSPAEEQAQSLQPRVEQDSCAASSLFYTIGQLNWSGSDDEVA